MKIESEYTNEAISRYLIKPWNTKDTGKILKQRKSREDVKNNKLTADFIIAIVEITETEKDCQSRNLWPGNYHSKLIIIITFNNYFNN